VDTAPNGWTEIVNYYTLPERDETGHVTDAWKEKNLGLLTSPFPFYLSWGDHKPVSMIYCHKKIIEPLQAVLEDIRDYASKDPTIGLDLGVWFGQSYGGCYADRAIRGVADHLSMHAFGAALDFRVAMNPLGGEAEPRMRDVIAPIFKKRGFTWGGDFESRKDPQHFQFASGY